MWEFVKNLIYLSRLLPIKLTSLLNVYDDKMPMFGVTMIIQAFLCLFPKKAAIFAVSKKIISYFCR